MVSFLVSGLLRFMCFMMLCAFILGVHDGRAKSDLDVILAAALISLLWTIANGIEGEESK